MPNLFTRVPDRPVPRLPAWCRWAVPVADAFMILMASRPSSGSLARTWVTPASRWMCATLAPLAIGVGIAFTFSSGGWIRAGGAAAVLIGLGALAVAVVGIGQRVADRAGAQ